jgi:hypothetical protein
MILFLWPYRYTLLVGPVLLASFVLFAASSFGAVLNPFPSPERPPIYQQATPRHQQTQTSPELEQFKRDITQFSCSDLNALYDRIRRQFNAAVTKADKEYYNGFLGALYDEKTKRCKK